MFIYTLYIDECVCVCVYIKVLHDQFTQFSYMWCRREVSEPQ